MGGKFNEPSNPCLPSIEPSEASRLFIWKQYLGTTPFESDIHSEGQAETKLFEDLVHSSKSTLLKFLRKHVPKIPFRRAILKAVTHSTFGKQEQVFN